jgi:diguanylate cyclase (GGDEF)-like protein/PAS domain S-box-containing protein
MFFKRCCYDGRLSVQAGLAYSSGNEVDISTLFLIIALTNILLAIAMAAMADRPGQPAMWLWSLAMCVNASAYLGFFWAAHRGYPLLVLVSNSMLALWLILISAGLEKFYHGRCRVPPWVFWIPLPIMVIGLIPLLDEFQSRVFFTSTLLSFQITLLLLILLRNRNDPPGRGQIIIVISLIAALLLLGLRMLTTGIGGVNNTSGLLPVNTVHVVTFLGVLLTTILLALGLIVMTQERTVQTLIASERRFRILFEDSQQPQTLLNQAGVFTAANQAALVLFHLHHPEQLIGRSLTDFAPVIQPDGRPSADHLLEIQQQTLVQGGYECEWHCLSADAEPLDALMMLTVIQHEKHTVFHVAWSNITRRKAAEAQLRINEEKFRTFVEDANDIIYTLSMDGVFQYISPNIAEILKLPPEGFVGCHFATIVHPDDLPECQIFLERLLTTRSKQSGLEYRVKHKTDGWHWHITNASPLFGKDGDIVGMLGIAHDITERKKNESKMMHMAHHDELTGLPNRALLFSSLHQTIANASSTGKMLALMFLDLDRFKPINDTHGHAVGDQVLRQAALRLLESVRETDTVARIGGDEFIVMLPDMRQMNHALEVAEKIRQLLQEPFCVEDLVLEVSSSIGIAFYPLHGRASEELAQCADIAMYYAKQNGANQIQVYTPELTAASRAG